ncbi:MAG: potassium channel family protein, partial [Bacteroidales bacterium]|nr:potassium channel family protein [Bacteroidales bacterium]
GRTLMAVVSLAISYIFITALIMFNVEFENELAGEKAMFNNIFDAIYWAACTLTTVGYGDIYPVSATGRLISMVSAIVGVAIIALPSGIITAGYMDELKVRREQKELKKGGGHHDSQNNQNAQ